MSRYQTKPLPLSGFPPGIPYIIGNEAAERFSYYGMRAILVVFMTQYMLSAAGQPDLMSQQEAQGYFHLFLAAVYFTPVLGALLADGFLGKYRTIILLSVVYCIGHFALALDDTRQGLLIGLSLIALGAGGIKPCVSSHVGDQFGQQNQHLLGKAFGWFYFAINLGAFTAMLIIPWLLEHFGSKSAFALPGLLMLLATVVFWSGRYRFIHVQPVGFGFLKEIFSQSGLQIFKNLLKVYLFITVFWSLFDQIGSSWVLQAQKMDRFIGSIEILPSQIQAANPLLIMVLVPFFTYWLYPGLARLTELTPIKKMSLGLLLTVAAFTVSTVIEIQLEHGFKPHITWQILAYLILTSAEVMVSITCLEFSYTQAPNSMKSFVMALYFLSVALGNLFTSAVNFFILNEDGSSKLEGHSYFLFFTVVMLFTALIFAWVNRNYKINSFIQDQQTA